MAGGMDLGTPSNGGKKPLDMAVNLVPFIDLMAVTISFLIMTAVWTQIGKLQVAQSGATSPDDQQQEENQVAVTLVVTDKELKLQAGQTTFDPIPVTRDEKNRIDLTRLGDKIKELKSQLPTEPTAITVQTEDSVRYEDLVRIIDACKGLGLENVSLAAVG